MTSDTGLPHDQIRKYARRALDAAGALDVTPVPLEDVRAAVGLRQTALFDLQDDAPPRIRDIAKRLSSRVLGAMAIPEKTIYVDTSLRSERQRFTVAHEIGHKDLPWHEQAYFADDKFTLSIQTREELEQEANLYAAEILFGLDRFTEQADAYAPSLAVAMKLAQSWNMSNHATLRRYAETTQHPIALLTFGQHLIVGGTALKLMTGQSVTSASFADKYGSATDLVGNVRLADHQAAAILARLSGGVHNEPIDIDLDTRRGMVRFQAHLFFNRRLRFMLLTKRQLLGRRIKLINDQSGKAAV